MIPRLACRYCASRALDYVQGQLSAPERERVESHLSGCARCRREIEGYKQTMSFVQSTAQEPIPARRLGWDQLSARLEPENIPSAPTSGRHAKLRLVTTVCALGVIAVLALVVTRGLHGTSDPSEKERVTYQLAPYKVEHPLMPLRIDPEHPLPETPKQDLVVNLPPPVVKKAPRNYQKPAQKSLALLTKNMPGLPTAQKKPSDDLEYLNSDAVASASGWTHWPSDDLHHMEVKLQKNVRGGDGFVSVSLPAIAGSDERSVHSAAVVYQQEKAIVDVRLVRKVTLAVKGMPFTDLCRRLSQDTGIQLTANRRVAEDKVTIFCHEKPLRDIMREVSALFGFTWLRAGNEGAYEYELTQSMRSQLLEEGMLQKDRDEMLIAVDRQMEKYRKYLGLSLSEVRQKKKQLEESGKLQDKAVFAEYDRLNMLEHGGLVTANLFFRLSQTEMDSLRSGQELTWDLSNGSDLPLPPSVLDGVRDTFRSGVTFQNQPPPRTDKLTATLHLDTKRPGQYSLMGGLQREDGGMAGTLAEVKSPSVDRDRVDNEKDNAALAGDPALQARLSLKLKPTYELKVPPYPDTDGAYVENPGPKVLTSDVLEAIYQKTGKDIIADQFMHLHDPAQVSVEDGKLFDVLNRSCDAMLIRWTKSEDWLRFRSPSFYYARPQEVPSRLMERWAERRKKQGVLMPEDLAEISLLTDAQLQSNSTAQGAVACYGLEEWSVARVEQGRPHWRFLARLPQMQRQDAFSGTGLAFSTLSLQNKRQFIELSESAQDGLWPSESEMRGARLQVLYFPEGKPGSHNTLGYEILGGNAAIFLYSYGQPTRYSAIGPFNAIIGLSEPMMDERRKKVPSRVQKP